jgi:AbrB family looped-hinge helix DNA binding protein
MTRATMTHQGQIILPQEIRNYLKLAEGNQVDFVIDENGDVKMIPLTTPVEMLSGILHRPGISAATLEEMEASIVQGAHLMNPEETSDWT